MTPIIPLLLILFSCQIAYADSLSSEKIDYNGKQLLLEGSVKVQHGLGMMSADSATLIKSEHANASTFAFLNFKKNVHIDFKKNNFLKCEALDLDFVNLKGTATGKQISYQDTLQTKKGREVTLQLYADKAEFDMSLNEKNTSGAQYQIDALFAQRNITVLYGKQITITADRAHYYKDVNHSPFKKNISAFPSDQEHPCLVTYGQNTIKTDQIDIDFSSGKIDMKDPRGVIQSESEGSKPLCIDFRCQALLWDPIQGLFSLSREISLKEPLFGDLYSEGKIDLIENNQTIHEIQAHGKTTLTHASCQTLVSYGVIQLDRKNLHAQIESPRFEGEVINGKQIEYVDGVFKIFADRAKVQYSQDGASYTATDVSLSGDIKITSHKGDKLSCFGRADKVHYFPKTRTIVLQAEGHKKVLFFNGEENLSLSAQEIHISQDPLTNKPAVKGVGNVQMHFTQEERVLLRKLFNFFGQNS